MYHCIESIKLLDGKFFRTEFHQQRIDKAFAGLYPSAQSFNLDKLLESSHFPKAGLYKCRITFDIENINITYEPYRMRNITSLQSVVTKAQCMEFKTEDRVLIQQAFDQRGDCDDIIMLKNGLLTDTSYANIALFDGNNWYTPAQPLLKGTNRAFLLSKGYLKEADIYLADIQKFSKIRIFNALIEFGDLELNTDAIRKLTY